MSTAALVIADSGSPIPPVHCLCGEQSVATWPDRLADWMKSRGLLEAKK